MSDSHGKRQLEGPVLVVGDVMCDHYLRGDVTRVSPEAPVQILEWEHEERRVGGAANVALNLASLGCRVRLAGIVGADDDGRWLRASLDRAGVDTDAMVTSRATPTTSKLRIIARGQQLLRVDREARSPVAKEDERAILDGIGRAGRTVAGVIVSDYAKGVVGPAVLDLLLRRRTDPRSDDREPLVLVDPKGGEFERYRGADILTPNEHELAEATGGDAEGTKTLGDRATDVHRATGATVVLVTRGARGMDLFEFGGSVPVHTHVPVFQAHEVFDVTGAGDTVAAVVGIEAFARRSLVDAARLATTAAGFVVATVGTTVVERAAIERVTGGAWTPSGAKIVTRAAAVARLREARARGARVVFTNGCFDMLHTGHLYLLQRARALGDLLVVGINSDSSVAALKGPSRPLIGQDQRAALLAALSCVDYVIVFSEPSSLNTIEAVEPDVLVKGADYALDEVVGRDSVERRGGRVELIPFLPGFSTSTSIESLLRPAKSSG